MAGFGRTLRRAAFVLATLALAGGGAVAVSSPAGATTVTDEATFRAAWSDVNETQIDLAADITLTCPGGAAVRGATTALTLDGHGHSITQSCPGNRVLAQNGTGALTIQNVTITGGNTTGITDDGAGILSSAPLTLRRSTITNNHLTGSSSFGGGVFASTLTVEASTFVGNSAGFAGGGTSGGTTGTVVIVNSTITGNTAGVRGGGVDGDDRSVTLAYDTITNNTSSQGNGTNVSLATLTSFASVVAQPTSDSNCGLLLGTTSNGFNFSDDNSCGFTAATDRQNAGSPGLGALANNGGPTQTRLPQAGSPLIDAIPNASCQADGASGITTDQRGLARPEITGGLCDIGAVEVQPPPGPTRPGPTPATPVQAVVRFTG